MITAAAARRRRVNRGSLMLCALQDELTPFAFLRARSRFLERPAADCPRNYRLGVTPRSQDGDSFLKPIQSPPGRAVRRCGNADPELAAHRPSERHLDLKGAILGLYGPLDGWAIDAEPTRHMASGGSVPGRRLARSKP